MAFVALIVAQSPLFHGVDSQRKAAWLQTDRMMRAMHASIGELPEPALVRFAVPHYTRKPAEAALRARARFERPALPLRQAELWMGALDGGREIEVRGFLTYERHPLRPQRAPELTERGGGWELLLPAELAYHCEAGEERFERSGEMLHVCIEEDDESAGVPSWFHFDDGTRTTTVRLGSEEPGP